MDQKINQKMIYELDNFHINKDSYNKRFNE